MAARAGAGTDGTLLSRSGTVSGSPAVVRNHSRDLTGRLTSVSAPAGTDTFSYVDRLPMGYHDRQSIGELTTRVIQDTGRIEDSLVDLFSTFVPAVLTLVGTGVVCDDGCNVDDGRS